MKPKMRFAGGPRPGTLRLNQKGITMVEVLIVIGVIMFVMSMVTVLSKVGLTAWQKQTARVKLETYAQNVMTVLAYNLRQAQPGTVSISNNTGELNESMITFKLIGNTNPVSIYLQSQKNSSGTIVNRQVIFTEPEGSTPSYLPKVLATNVVSLYFTYPKISDTSRIMANIALRSVPLKSLSAVYFQSQEIIYVRN